MLGVGLRQFLVAVRLVRGVGARLVLQLLDHVGDEAFNFCEGVLAHVLADAHGGGHPLRQLRQPRRLLFAGQLAYEANCLEMGEVRGGPEAGGGHLQEGRLVETIRDVVRPAGRLLEDLLGVGEGLELLGPRLGLQLEVLRLGPAVLVEVFLRGDVRLQLLGCDCQVSFRGRLRLPAGSDALLGVVEVLVAELDGILQRLLQHLEVVGVGGLRLPRPVELLLGLVQETLEHVNDTSAVALVHSRIGSAGVVETV
mmetsp:Transcript_77434/g.201814  ORF Transcript_77434/g.201814 Transcript_77434/m.201814 type:complete len:254 (+) Transcript_77434:791-1552(+)